MNVAQMQELKNTPADQRRDVIDGFNLDELKTSRQLRQSIKRIQDGGKFSPKDFVVIIDGLSLEIAKVRYCDEDGYVAYNNTVVDALVRRDVFGGGIAAYIKQLPAWEAIVDAGLE